MLAPPSPAPPAPPAPSDPPAPVDAPAPAEPEAPPLVAEPVLVLLPPAPVVVAFEGPCTCSDEQPTMMKVASNATFSRVIGDPGWRGTEPTVVRSRAGTDLWTFRRRSITDVRRARCEPSHPPRA